MNALGVRPSFATGFAQGPGESEYPELWRGLVGAYDPSLGQTGSRLIDWSGKLKHGILVADTHWVLGPYGWVLAFGGAGDYISLPLSLTTALNGLSSASISFWARPNSIASDQRCIGLYSADPNERQIFIWMDSGGSGPSWAGNCELTISSPSNIGEDATLPVSITEFQHIVFTLNKAVTSIYINGILRDSDSSGEGVFETSSSQYRIGSLEVLGDFNGDISQVLIYNRTLIPAEISLIHQLRKQVA